MVIFHGYVCLPQGITFQKLELLGFMNQQASLEDPAMVSIGFTTHLW